MPNKKSIYSKRTLKSANKYEIEDRILNALEGDKGIKKEIAKIFQVANRRIENIENTGLKSPAVESLGELKKGFSKFSVSGLSWSELLIEYGRAVSFLQKPTSTASGTRELYKDVAKSVNLPPKILEQIIKEHGDDIFEGTEFKYVDLVNELKTVAQNYKNSIERGAVDTAQELQNQVNNIVNKAASGLENIINLFEKFE